MDDFYITLVQKDTPAPYVLSILLFGIGAIVSAIRINEQFLINRLGYIASSGGLLIGLSILSLIALGISSFFGGLQLTVFFILDSIIMFLGGFWYWKLSCARSLDICQNKSKAILGLIPIANFVLFFTPSGEFERGDKEPEKETTGNILISLGLAIILMMGSNFINEQIGKELGSVINVSIDKKYEEDSNASHQAYLEQSKKDQKKLNELQQKHNFSPLKDEEIQILADKISSLGLPMMITLELQMSTAEIHPNLIIVKYHFNGPEHNLDSQISQWDDEICALGMFERFINRRILIKEEIYDRNDLYVKSNYLTSDNCIRTQ